MFGVIVVKGHSQVVPSPGVPASLTVEAGYGVAEDSVEFQHVAVFIDGRPNWQDGTREPATALSIAKAYVSEGLRLLTRLNGGFSLAMFDSRSRTLHLATDRMGIETLAWANRDGTVVFGTSPRQVAVGAYNDVVLAPQALYDYFFFHMVPSPGSVFQGVRKAEAAKVLSFNESEQRVSAYWKATFSDRASDDIEGLAADLRKALRCAVSAIGADARTGAFLSGGLDSSTVTGVLASISQRPPKTFSVGFGVDGYDELAYARIASRHFKCEGHEYVMTPRDVLDAIPVVAREYDEPFGNSSAIPTYCCARFARENAVDTLLAGDGGDELFGGNERYARQRIFEVFQLLPASVRAIVTYAARPFDPNSSILPLRKFRSYVDQASIPLPERLESWNFVYREGASLLFDDDFFREVDPQAPIHAMAATYHETGAPDLLDRMLVYDWKYTLADNDLRKVSAMCRAAGVRVRYPMLDNDVVAMSLRVPSHLKLRGLELRSFYKTAMRGFLPEAILSKKKHGFGLPFGVWLKTDAALAEFIYSSLSDLKLRRIVKPSFIDRLIDEHRAGHPGYYGYVIWDLVILEEWLKHLPNITFRSRPGTIERMS